MSMISCFSSIPQVLEHWVCEEIKRFPIIVPAVKDTSCEVDEELLRIRVSRTFWISIASLFVLTTVSALFPIIPLVTILVLPVVYMMITPWLDRWLSERAVDRKAVDEYVSGPLFHSAAATHRIRNSMYAAQLLIDSKYELGKLDDKGEILLDAMPNIEVAKFLIDNEADDFLSTNSQGRIIFQKIFSMNDPTLLEYVLKKNYVSAEDFTEDEQVALWTSIGSKKTALLLAEYKFDVNIKDDNGYTALMKVVRQQSHHSNRLSVYSHVIALLSAGADPLLTVVEEDVHKSAINFTDNHQIKRIFETLQQD